MTAEPAAPTPWAERVADRSATVQRSRARQMEQAQAIVAAARRLIAESCVDYELAAADLPDPVARLHYYVTVIVGGLADPAYGVGPRFVTAEHWRLHQLFPEEMAHATQHFTDLVARQLELAAAEGLLAPRDIQRDAWFVTKLVMAVFHHYAYAGDPEDARATGEELWEFCLRALGGRVT